MICSPNTSLASLTRFASDHVPLLVSAASKIPRGACFRFENSWLRSPHFLDTMTEVLQAQLAGSPSKTHVRRLKTCRSACRAWAKRLRPLDVREWDTKILINALDLLEEERQLAGKENELRSLAIQELQAIHSEKLCHWRQRFNLRMPPRLTGSPWHGHPDACTSTREVGG